jgi:hypothetical protein
MHREHEIYEKQIKEIKKLHEKQYIDRQYLFIDETTMWLH